MPERVSTGDEIVEKVADSIWVADCPGGGAAPSMLPPDAAVRQSWEDMARAALASLSVADLEALLAERRGSDA